jgi:hypothetical protein
MLEPGTRSAEVDSGVEAQVIRAVFIRIEALSSGEAAGEKAVSREIGLGHALVPEITRRLTFYEHHRAEFPTLASFLPQLFKGLQPISGIAAPAASDSAAAGCNAPARTEIASAAVGQSPAGAQKPASRALVDAAAVRVRETL